MQTIKVEGLTKTFGTVNAVSNLSFSAEPGKVTAFLGPNGSGKTTTMRMMLNLTAPTSGTCHIGSKVYKEYESPMNEVGAVIDGVYIPQDVR